jgi:hypothetical protein
MSPDGSNPQGRSNFNADDDTQAIGPKRAYAKVVAPNSPATGVVTRQSPCRI